MYVGLHLAWLAWKGQSTIAYFRITTLINELQSIPSYSTRKRYLCYEEGALYTDRSMVGREGSFYNRWFHLSRILLYGYAPLHLSNY